MANIRVEVGYTIVDGSEIKFRAPIDCSKITGLIVYYIDGYGETRSKEFALADAHGNNVGDIEHLFAESVVVKVILDVTKGMAYVQNADTNAYLEGQFGDLRDALGGKAPAGFGLGNAQKVPFSEIDKITQPGWYWFDGDLKLWNDNWHYGYMRVEALGAGTLDARQTMYLKGETQSVIAREKYNGAWRNKDVLNGWYYVKPSFQLNTAYKTPFEIDGKPVYVKRTRVKYGGAGVLVDLTVGTGARPIAVFGWDNARLLPFRNDKSDITNVWTTYASGVGVIHVKCYESYSQYANFLVFFINENGG